MRSAAMIADPDHETGAYGVYLNPYPLPSTGHAFGAGELAVIAWSYDAGCELVLLNGAIAVDGMAHVFNNDIIK